MKKFEDLKVGDPVIARNEDGEWYTTQILRINVYDGVADVKPPHRNCSTWQIRRHELNNTQSAFGWKPVENDGIEVKDNGAKQSHLDVALDLIPANAIIKVGKVLYAAAQKYGENNHKGLTEQDHLRHALAHIYAHLDGANTGEDDLAHAATRLLLALGKK